MLCRGSREVTFPSDSTLMFRDGVAGWSSCCRLNRLLTSASKRFVKFLSFVVTPPLLCRLRNTEATSKCL